jgi:hypothetical protein
MREMQEMSYANSEEGGLCEDVSRGKRLIVLLGTVVIGGILAAGTLSDAMCGITHKGPNAAACMKACVNNVPSMLSWLVTRFMSYRGRKMN